METVKKKIKLDLQARVSAFQEEILANCKLILPQIVMMGKLWYTNGRISGQRRSHNA